MTVLVTINVPQKVAVSSCDGNRASGTFVAPLNPGAGFASAHPGAGLTITHRLGSSAESAGSWSVGSSGDSIVSSPTGTVINYWDIVLGFVRDQDADKSVEYVSQVCFNMLFVLALAFLFCYAFRFSVSDMVVCFPML